MTVREIVTRSGLRTTKIIETSTRKVIKVDSQDTKRWDVTRTENWGGVDG